MTPSRYLAACGVVAALALLPSALDAQGARGAAPPLPGQDVGPLEKKANPVTPENPLPRRTYSIAPFYPSEASGTGLALTFTVKATLGPQGRVDEARVTGYRIDGVGVSSVETFVQYRQAFEKAALDAVREWLYDAPASPPISFYTQIRFVPDAESTITWHDPSPPPTVAATAGVASAPPAIPGAIRVGGNVSPPTRIKDVKPVYPPIARSAKVSGIVIVEVTIGADGRVADARVIRSIPLLDQAAIDAVRQWEFTPTLLNGAPTPIVMSTTVNFQLE
jgi:protein TonB